MAWLTDVDYICAVISYHVAGNTYLFNIIFHVPHDIPYRITINHDTYSHALVFFALITLFTSSTRTESGTTSRTALPDILTLICIPVPSFTGAITASHSTVYPRTARSSTAARPAIPSILTVQSNYDAIPSYPVVPLPTSEFILICVHIRTPLPNDLADSYHGYVNDKRYSNKWRGCVLAGDDTVVSHVVVSIYVILGGANPNPCTCIGFTNNFDIFDEPKTVKKKRGVSICTSNGDCSSSCRR